MVKTKIICTIGPASEDVTVLRKMMLAGMDMARLNFSHGSHAKHGQRIESIRQLNEKYRRHIKIMLDLEGYRIRVGKLRDKRPVELRKRQVIRLINKNILGSGNTIPFDYTGPLGVIRNGSHIYIDDGNIDLVVKDRGADYLVTEVAVPGLLKENKGINMPEVNLKFKGLTDKDRRDLDFGIEHKVDYVAQSFVRSKDDIKPIRDFVKDRLPGCQIFAKIENQQGIKNVGEIITATDGIIIARGDMGVSIPIYEVPMVQKAIIRKCNRAGKLVVTATQMLESMTEHLRPTRAEVTDVANAILDGSNYLMLSAETAVGRYPFQVVKMMNQIIMFTEQSIKRGGYKK